jgi:hypothetical protein
MAMVADYYTDILEPLDVSSIETGNESIERSNARKARITAKRKNLSPAI